jgi:hypothetical protein
VPPKEFAEGVLKNLPRSPFIRFFDDRLSGNGRITAAAISPAITLHQIDVAKTGFPRNTVIAP